MSLENNTQAEAEAAPPEAVAVSFDRLPGEPPKAFAAFRAYITMGPDRSIRKLGRKYGKHMSEGAMGASVASS